MQEAESRKARFAARARRAVWVNPRRGDAATDATSGMI